VREEGGYFDNPASDLYIVGRSKITKVKRGGRNCEVEKKTYEEFGNWR